MLNLDLLSWDTCWRQYIIQQNWQITSLNWKHFHTQPASQNSSLYINHKHRYARSEVTTAVILSSLWWVTVIFKCHFEHARDCRVQFHSSLTKTLYRKEAIILVSKNTSYPVAEPVTLRGPPVSKLQLIISSLSFSLSLARAPFAFTSGKRPAIYWQQYGDKYLLQHLPEHDTCQHCSERYRAVTKSRSVPLLLRVQSGETSYIPICQRVASNWGK